MAKRAKRRSASKLSSRRARLWALIKRNPIKSATAVLALLAAVPGGIKGLDYINTTSDPWKIALHGWTRELLETNTAPYIKVQTDHDYAINYLILKDQRQALKDAQEELHKHPDSTTAPLIIERLTQSIERRQKKLDGELKGK